MPADSKQPQSDKVNRRKFLEIAAGTAGAMLVKPALVRGTGANSAVRVGLLGCGGRGTEDASNLVDTGSARVVALADLFADQLDAARAHFDQLQQPKGYPALDAKQLFVGPNAYQQIASSKEVDAIVIATPPYFHPHHLETVLAAGRHVYLEKPVAVDVPGALRVLELGKRAEGKLSLDVGFQIRDCPPFVELVRRIHDGALGKIICGEAHYLTGYIDRPPWPDASPAERRLRNWVYDRVLSGDIIVEQNIHVIDICNWILKAHPLKASASGGRAGRPPGDGDVYGLPRSLPLSRFRQCHLQLHAIRQGLVGCHRTLLRHERDIAIALHRPAGRLGRPAVASSAFAGERCRAAALFGDRKLQLQSRARRSRKEKGFRRKYHQR